ncbi:MAG: DUF3604 domain-containing protein [Myxococcales bacterium]|nr:DUF3604 domain-containing protein [Myxococcales bacterium]
MARLLITLPLLLLVSLVPSMLVPSKGLAIERTETRQACAEMDPLRRPFFGDTHVHTALSFDAAGQGTRNLPADAYQFAKGEPLGIQPYDIAGNALRTIQLHRPLDFAVVTDHSELLGETHACRTPGSIGYDSFVCIALRRWPKLTYLTQNGRIFSAEVPTHFSFCGEDGARCREAALAPWKLTQQAAEDAYDRSAACRFTSFVGYEWTGMPGGDNTHRNIIFRNERVQRLPTNYIDTPNDEDLWRALERECLERDDGCDVIAIPHNSNLSNGRLFRVETSDGNPITRADAERRSRLEVLVEVTQHKGDSECRSGAPVNDELCGFETLSFPRMQDMLTPQWADPIPPLVYVREILIEGLAQHDKLGANPFKLGLIGSTDTHLAAPGHVEEDRFAGHAAGPVSARLEEPPMLEFPSFNPGGLAVIWAEENSRDALFEAMRRRETYGTSGTRIEVRFFGGWDYEHDLCGNDDFVARGYAGGVPMGADLAPATNPTSSPAFAVWAKRDPGSRELAGTKLQRVQIIKGWVEKGDRRELVYDVAGDAGNAARVDLATCLPSGPGFDDLCSVWRDPDFSADEHALYYARVVENPSCRWSQYVCNRRGVDCSDPSSVSGDLAACCDPEIPKTIQERAWTSPIWYTPPGN